MTVTLIRALLIYFTVILAMRIMGKRQIGELNPHELVITILVSQIASIPLQDNTMPLANAFLPMLCGCETCCKGDPSFSYATASRIKSKCVACALP